jgi:hypothetical protein
MHHVLYCERGRDKGATRVERSTTRVNRLGCSERYQSAQCLHPATGPAVRKSARATRDTLARWHTTSTGTAAQQQQQCQDALPRRPMEDEEAIEPHAPTATTVPPEFGTVSPRCVLYAQ